MPEDTFRSEDRIIEAASTWLVRMRETDPSQAEKAAFADWLLESPAHVREYLSCEIVWSWLEELDWEAVFGDELLDQRIGAAGVPRGVLRSIH